MAADEARLGNNRRALLKIVKAMDRDVLSFENKSISDLEKSGDYILGDSKPITARGLIVALKALGVLP